MPNESNNDGAGQVYKRNPLTLLDCCLHSVYININHYCGGLHPLEYECKTPYFCFDEEYAKLSAECDGFYSLPLQDTMGEEVEGPFEMLPWTLREKIFSIIVYKDFRHYYFLIDQHVRQMDFGSVMVWHHPSEEITGKFLALRCKNLRLLKFGVHRSLTPRMLSIGLATMIHLREIDFGTASMTDEVLDVMGKNLVNLIHLEMLCCKDITDVGIRYLLSDGTENRPGCLKLQHISLPHTVSCSSVSLLLQGLPDLTKLSSCNVNKALIYLTCDAEKEESNAEGTQKLAPVKVFHAGVETIKLKHMVISPESYKPSAPEKLYQVLARMTHLNEIHISNLCKENEPVDFMVKPVFLHQGRFISSLSLMQVTNLEHVISVLMRYCKCLKHLDIMFDEISEEEDLAPEPIPTDVQVLPLLEDVHLIFTKALITLHNRSSALNELLGLPSLKKVHLKLMFIICEQWMYDILEKTDVHGEYSAFRNLENLCFFSCSIRKEELIMIIDNAPKLEKLTVLGYYMPEEDRDYVYNYIQQAGLQLQYLFTAYPGALDGQGN